MPGIKTRIMMKMMQGRPRFNPLPPDGDYKALRRSYYENNARLPVDKGAAIGGEK
jgi:hypothetical protein